ncbi:MAG TPA: F0F1 ATP synthase subunit A [Verrucomicrobiae bacterium]|nr:F0F1 ATP synthase subunit A [Verrucomicrobiae bacterium]
MTEEAVQAAGHAAEAGGEGAFNPNALLAEHVLDQRTLEVPFLGHVHLPILHLGPYALPITRHVVMMWIAAVIVLLVSCVAARRRARVPGRLQSLVELIVVFVRDELARKSIGHHADRYVPFLLTVFFFIMTCNYLGLLPYAATATSNISVTAGLALLAFVMTQAAGIREYGVAGHAKNLIPPGLPAWLLPIMIPVELLGIFTKPFALCVRLFANMTAGHVIILSLFSIVFLLKSVMFGVFVSVPFALFINGIELLVAFLQAYIFTMLTALFIGMSAHPAH